VKPAIVRFYVDADLLGLATVVAGLRSDITYPGDPGAVIHKRARPPCRIEPGTLDVDWLPQVAQAGWLIITRDKHIQLHRAEINAVLEHGAKMVALAGDDASNKWAQLEVLMVRWREIEAITGDDGPFVYTAFRTKRLKQVA
jgi:hypothetical protein